MAASSSFGPDVSSTWRSVTLAAPVAPSLGHVEVLDVGLGATGRLGGEGLGPHQHDLDRVAGELGLDVGGATEDRLDTDDVVAVDLESTMLVMTGAPSLADSRPATSRPS